MDMEPTCIGSKDGCEPVWALDAVTKSQRTNENAMCRSFVLVIIVSWVIGYDSYRGGWHTDGMEILESFLNLFVIYHAIHMPPGFQR